MKTGDFSEIIAASDLKVSRSRHLIEYMKIYSLFCFPLFQWKIYGFALKLKYRTSLSSKHT